MKKYGRFLIISFAIFITSNNVYCQKPTITIEQLYCYKIDGKYGEGYENRYLNNRPIELNAGEHTFEIYDASKAQSAYRLTVKLEENKQYKIRSKKGEILFENNENKIDFGIKNISVPASSVEKIKMEGPDGKKQTFKKTDLSDKNSNKEPARLYYYKGSNLSENAVLKLFKVDDYWGFEGNFNHFAQGSFVIILEPGVHKLEGITYGGTLGPSDSLISLLSYTFEEGKEYVFKLTGKGRYTTASIIEKK